MTRAKMLKALKEAGKDVNLAGKIIATLKKCCGEPRIDDEKMKKLFDNDVQCVLDAIYGASFELEKATGTYKED